MSITERLADALRLALTELEVQKEEYGDGEENPDFDCLVAAMAQGRQALAAYMAYALQVGDRVRVKENCGYSGPALGPGAMGTVEDVNGNLVEFRPDTTYFDKTWAYRLDELELIP